MNKILLKNLYSIRRELNEIKLTGLSLTQRVQIEKAKTRVNTQIELLESVNINAFSIN